MISRNTVDTDKVWLKMNKTVKDQNNWPSYFCIECGVGLKSFSPNTLFCGKCGDSINHMKVHEIVYDLHRQINDLKEEKNAKNKSKGQ